MQIQSLRLFFRCVLIRERKPMKMEIFVRSTFNFALFLRHCCVRPDKLVQGQLGQRHMRLS